MILNLLDRMKLPFRKNKEFLKALYDILGFYPHDIEIYRIAFSHKSLTYRRDRNTNDKRGANREKRNKPEAPTKPLNNERLEYLGDAVLETVVSDILFRHFNTKREGFLTSTRSKIVQREALNRLATQMGLETLIQAAQGTRMVHTNIGGNAFEALMGAIYLDRGFKYCHWFIENRVIGHYVDLESVAQKEVNFKSKLLEWCQKNRINTNFRDSASNDSERGFRSTIVLEGITVGKGTGRSKKESQQVASKDALTRMRKEQKLYDSIFRAKEKRTAMEADESFALPKIDEIENIISKSEGKRKPVLEGKPAEADADEVQQLMDSAYDEAYNEKAEFEVIGNAEEESEYSEYATDIQPDATAEEVEHSARTQPTAVLPEKKTEEERPAPVTKAQRRRERNRSAKTVDDAVKGGQRRAKVQKQEEKPAEKPQPVAQTADEKPKQPTDKAEQPNSNECQQRKERRKGRVQKDMQSASLEDKSQSTTQPTKVEGKAVHANPYSEETEDKDTDELITLQATILEDTSANEPARGEIVVNRVITCEDDFTKEEHPAMHQDTPADEMHSEADKVAHDQKFDAIAAEVAALAKRVVAEHSIPRESHTDSQDDILPLTDIPSEDEANEKHTVPTAEEPPAVNHSDGKDSDKTSTEDGETTESATDDSPESAEDNGAIAAEEVSADNAFQESTTEELTVAADDALPCEEDSSAPAQPEEAEEEEGAYDEDESDEVRKQPPYAADHDSARPHLRHLTLDDFVFGTTDATHTDLEEAATDEEGMENFEANRPKRNKPRRRRRKPQSAEEGMENAATDRNDTELQPSQPQQKKHKPQRRRQEKQSAGPADQLSSEQKQAALGASDEDAEKLAKRRAAQRRRRRRERGNGNEASSPSSDN